MRKVVWGGAVAVFPDMLQEGRGFRPFLFGLGGIFAAIGVTKASRCAYQ
ncbi:hypothetical protein FHS81_000457 [Pseudochelatococcus contaminans]|uniref:Uncharacterized protein n=1 Tax=Pseudochelatococcus contaminans TaxID=1538103 RepID=A0A7W5Z1M3_9HYPH|nr:hypothetical protein [Pseudochelatococcus contaminans]